MVSTLGTGDRGMSDLEYTVAITAAYMVPIALVLALFHSSERRD